MRMVLLALVLWQAAAAAEDPDLTALRRTLSSLRERTKGATIESPPPGPELRRAKLQLREWIEQQLATAGKPEAAVALAPRLTKILNEISPPHSKDQNLYGSLGKVRIEQKPGALVVTTGVGILCEHDESTYAYRRTGGHWQKIWQSEQDDYTNGKYTPQHISDVHVWPTEENGPIYFLTLGNREGCISAWQRVYYRIWRVSDSGSRMLVDDSEVAFLRADAFIMSSMGRDWKNDRAPVDVLVEFAQRSIDNGVHNREAIRHFQIQGDTVKRVEPVALSPRDFVDEWLTQPWSESAGWSESPALRLRHQKLHRHFVAGEFDPPTLHCDTPDLWQVSLEPRDEKKDFAPEPLVWFLVRWRPPYRFSMVGVSDHPWPHCTQKDPYADQWRTLFATQEWR